ncbi:MAG: hypothetical protein IT384_34595 [Deltaproteobacteria bacterium]|nr:hypothetical protein [Deltaproteobacteria bacterium]
MLSFGRMRRRRCLLLVWCVMTGCGSDPTGVDLQLRYRPDLAQEVGISGSWLDHRPAFEPTRFALPGVGAEPRTESLAILFDDARAGEEVTLHARAFGPANTLVASASTTVTLESNRQVLASLDLLPPSVLPSDCGDGRVTGQETCDDGDDTGGDGCGADCQVESGYACGAECTPLSATRQIDLLSPATTDAMIPEPVPGSGLVLRPATGEIWLVVASGELSSSSDAIDAAEVLLAIDGLPRDRAGHALTPGARATFLCFDWIEGRGAPTRVELQFAAAAGRTTLIHTRLVLARIPANADFQAARGDPERSVTGIDQPVAELLLTPRAAGEYIVLAKAAQRNDAGSGATQAQLEIGSARRPDSPSGTGYSNPHSAWMSAFVALKTGSLLGPTRLTLRATSPGSGAGTPWFDPAYPRRYPVDLTATRSPPSDLDVGVPVPAGASSDPAGDDLEIVSTSLSAADRIFEPNDVAGPTVWFRPRWSGGSPAQARYHLYAGRGAPPAHRPEDQHVFAFFDPFDAPLDGSNWNDVADASPAGGLLTLSKDGRVVSRFAETEGFTWETRGRLSQPLPTGNGLEILAASDTSFSSYLLLGADTQGTFAAARQSSSSTVAVTLADPTVFHVFGIARTGSFPNFEARFYQDAALLTSITSNVPGGFLPLMLQNRADGLVATYDWVRVRRHLDPAPAVAVGPEERVTGDRPGRYASPRIIAFRADAFEHVGYAEQVSGARTKEPRATRTTLDQPATTSPGRDLIIQSLRLSGEPDAGRSAELSQNDEIMLSTELTSARGESAVDGEHQAVSVVYTGTSTSPASYANSFGSTNDRDVTAAESVIVVLRYFPE